MAKKKKKGSQSETVHKIAMATATLNLIRLVLEILFEVFEKLTE